MQPAALADLKDFSARYAVAGADVTALRGLMWRGLRRVSASIATVFAQDSAEDEVLSDMNFPRAHWLQIHSTNPLERLNAEIKRRTNVPSLGSLPRS